jgi:hypothetical protein
MSEFVKALTESSNLIINENGSYLNKSTNDPRVDAFFKLIRGVNSINLKNSVESIIKESDRICNQEMLRDLFILMFHKRNCRGGEGEKMIFYKLIIEIYNYYPITICDLIKLIPLYGYYKDYFEIWKLICELNITDKEKYQIYNPLIDQILKEIIQQLRIDCHPGSKSISLLCKWLPREGSHYDNKCFWYRSNDPEYHHYNSVVYLSNLFNNSIHNFIYNYIIDYRNTKSNNWCIMKYRKTISELNKKLNISEVLMCAKDYSSIEFEKVSSKAMKNYTKAFLNEKLKGPLLSDDEDTGNRYPDLNDRIYTRQKLKKFIVEGNINKINGKQLDPHEIMSKLYNSNSKLEKEILHSQWDCKKKDILVQTQELNCSEIIKGIGNCIPMIDVSGSMVGKQNSSVEPIEVAISLGIMTSELANKPYTNLAISFSEIPTIFSFKDYDYPEDKRKQIIENHIGYSTNFSAAIDLILKLCVNNKVPNNQIPNLLVFTDGQFDLMNKNDTSWKTCHQHLVTKWETAGYNDIPNIIYWNLRSNTPGFQTSADYPGVQMLQGYSPSLLKFVLFGEMYKDQLNDEINNQNEIKKITSYDTFRKVIDQEIYKPVYEILLNSKEKLLNYNFIPNTYQ